MSRNADDIAGHSCRFMHPAFQWLVCAVFFLMLTACGTTLPPVTTQPGDQPKPGRFIWFELLSNDPQRSRDFYKALFGWSFSSVAEDPSYELILHQRRAIGGMASPGFFELEQSAQHSQWLPVMSIVDIDNAVLNARAGGGQVVFGPQVIEGRGRFAIVQDSESYLVGLLRSENGDPAGNSAVYPEQWIWVELLAADQIQAAKFYASLAGYRVFRTELADGRLYTGFANDGGAVAGLIQVGAVFQANGWLPYIRVESVNDTASRAAQLGAKLIYMDQWAAVMRTPDGALLGLQMEP